MGRKPKRIEGVITGVRAIEKHKTQFRIRYTLNGVPDASYRAEKADAEKLHKELSTRAVLVDSKERTAITWLSAEQLKQAELAYQILGNDGLLDLNEDIDANLIATAARKFAEAVRRQGPPITIETAFEQFVAHQISQNRSKKTLADYNRFIAKRFVTEHGQKKVYLLTSDICHTFVMGHATQLDRFKSYGYLNAFLNFCAGKGNPAIDPTINKPWLSRNPINFRKPVYELKPIESYKLSEVKLILKKAYETGSLGYTVFRLFTLCRFEELQRFVTLGGGSRWESNKFVDLGTNQIDFPATVFKKRSNSQKRGRIIRIESTFLKWIEFCISKNLGFTYNRLKDENSRKVIPDKFGRNEGHNNLFRHTAITFHVKAHKNPADTAYIAGTSTEKIDSNYYNARLNESDAIEFYRLTPESLGLK